MNREALSAISPKIRDCTICPQVELCHVVGSLIHGDPEKDPSSLVFVGEAPGEMEAEKGVPFCGPSGALLREALDIAGEGSYTLLNVLKCRPPNNRDPTFTEAKNCYPYLKAQLEALEPKKVVALGKVADEALKALRIDHVSINHPSWALRQEMKAEEYSVEILRVLYEEEKPEEVISDLFPSFHTHSHFSVADSINTPEEIVAFAKAGGMPIIALTDHGTLGGVYDFEDAALAEEMPHVIGYEAYVTEIPIEAQKKTLYFYLYKHPESKTRKEHWAVVASGTGTGSKLEIALGDIDSMSEEEARKSAPTMFEAGYRDNKPFIKYMEKKGVDSLTFAWAGSSQTGHMNVWVISEEGWKNLLYLHNQAAKISTDRKAHVFIDSIRTGHAKGLIFGSACIGGFLAQKVLYLGEEAAYQWLEGFVSDLRKQSSTLILEVMPHPQVNIKPIPGVHNGLTQADLNRFLIDAGEDLQLNVIVTTDAHYTRPEDKEIKMQAAAMAYHKREMFFQDPNKEEYFAGNSYYFMTRTQVVEALSIGEAWVGVKPEEVEDLIVTTYLLAEKMKEITASFRLPRKFEPMNIDPNVDIESEVWGRWDQFKATHLEGASEETVKIYEDRLRLEVDRIKRKGFGWYFKIERAFVEDLKKAHIPVGPGRGSAGGSLMAYVLGITHVDPIRYGLLFDRFMSEQRNDPPDIDLDVATSRRGEAIDVLSGILQIKDIAYIMDYNRWKKDGAVRDICWLLELDQYEFEKNGAGMDIIQPMVERLTDRIRYRGTHASGFIGVKNLDQIFPLAKLSASKTIPSIEFELNTLNKLGMAKFDILGLTELDNLYMYEDATTGKPFFGNPETYNGTLRQPIIEAMERAGLWSNYEFFLEKISPHEIKYLLEEIAYKFPVGLFQLKTTAANMTINEIKPTTFEGLVHIIAINRPGPRESGMVDLYKKRKFDKEPYVPLPSTEDTYGCALYQEQILTILNKVFGMTLGEADEVRRHISKKKLEKLQKVEERLTEALLDPEKRHIWDQVMNWAAYGFNRAHALAYAVLSLMTIWAKAHMPEVFYAHVLNLEPDRVKRRAALREAKRMGITILRPNANFYHGQKFLAYQNTVVENIDGKNCIVLGFNTIKGLAEKTSGKVVEKLSKLSPDKKATKTGSLTVLQEVLLQKAGFWSTDKTAPYLSASLPLASCEVLPWHTYDFGAQSLIEAMPPGSSEEMTLIIYEGLDKIAKVEDNSGAYRFYSQGVNISKEDLKNEMVTGTIFKGNNDKVYLIEKKGDKGKVSIEPLSSGFKVVYATKPILSKAGNWFSITILWTPLLSGKGSRLIEATILAPKEYLGKLHRGVTLTGRYGNGFFTWEYEKQVASLPGDNSNE